MAKPLSAAALAARKATKKEHAALLKRLTATVEAAYEAGLTDIARHVIWDANVTQGTRVENMLDDVASHVCQALLRGGP